MAQQKSTFQPSRTNQAPGETSDVLSFSAYEKDIIEPMPSQHHRILEEDKQDPLVAWQLQREVYILAVILLVGIILVVGFFNRRVENLLLFALFLSGVIMALVFALLG